MATFVIMEPPRGVPSVAGRDAGPVFVRDGFAVVAFLVPLAWLLWHRLWIEAAVALAATVLLGVLGEMAGFGAGAGLLSLLVSIFAGLEGQALRIAALRRRGWTDAGIADADTLEDAEARYFAGDLEPFPEPAQAAPQPVPPVQVAARPAHGPALGLFAYPGKR